MNLIDQIRKLVRSCMHSVATTLNRLSGGHITPNSITIVSLLAHVVIAWLIAALHPRWAALLLVIFGLFDALDGELARLQHKDSAAGMLLDASTDRMKEVILYIGVAAYFMNHLPITTPVSSTLSSQVFYSTLLVVAACGGSLLVSYVKAKGETAMTGSGLSPNEINRVFQGGFMRYEIRMFLLIVGLTLSMGYLTLALFVIAAFSWLTALWRLVYISKKLS